MNASIIRRTASGILLRHLAFIALLAASAGTFAQIDGTLFTQPEERAYLDYLRDEFLRNNAEQGFDIEEAAVPVVPGAGDAQPTGPTEFNFGGVMTRRDGSRSVWLNGAAFAESELPGGMNLVNSERGTALRITHDGKAYVLRPGQTVDLLAGSVMESYQRPQASVSESTSATENAGEADTAEVVNDPVADGEDESPVEPATGIAATVDALTSAVGGLDDNQIAALLEALASLRPESAVEEDEADDAADDDEP